MRMIARILNLRLEVDRRKVSTVAILTIIAAVLPTAQPLIFGRVIDTALNGGKLTELFPMFGLLAAVTIGGALANVLAHSLGARVGYQLSWQLTRRLYYHVLRMPFLTYLTINSGVLNSRLTNDVRTVEPVFAEIPLSALKGWAGLLAAAICLIIIDAWFLIAFGLVPFALVVMRFGEDKVNSSIERAFQLNARIALQIDNSTSADAISLVRQARCTTEEERYFSEITGQSAIVSAELDSWRSAISTAYHLCFDIVSIALLIIGFWLSLSNQVSIGGVVSALFFVGMVREPLAEIVGQKYPLLRASIGLERVEEVLQSPNTGLENISASPKAQAVKLVDVELCFHNVSYSYPKRKEVEVASLSDIVAASSGSSGFLRGVPLTNLDESEVLEEDPSSVWGIEGVSFSVKRGETVAVTGHSGSGKSTILGLTCGMLRPTMGSISIGGRDIRLLTEEDVWNSVSLVSQDIYLRDASLRENLNYGLEEAADHKLIAALCESGLEGLIAELPNGLDTKVGQRGRRFSGGERQRIAIARAILRSRPILILDEATSHLDTAREASVLSAVSRIAEDKAVLVVAHRLSAIERANKIIVLKNGRIVESGVYSDLVRADGPFSRLHRGQSDG